MDDYPLSKRLYEETKSVHEQIESMDFILALRNLKLSQKEYAQYLADLKVIYEALENGLEDNQELPAIKAVYDPKINRVQKLEADLRSFESENLKPTEAAKEYAEHLQNLSKQAPAYLLAHAYVRYLGDLSGGRMMKKYIEQLFPGEHTAFYNFDELLGDNAIGAKYVDYKNAWKRNLDHLNFTENEKASLVEEAKKGFIYAGNLFNSYSKVHKNE
jgi:heme oxygenase (biliverdin-producing, ferredoxin)